MGEELHEILQNSSNEEYIENKHSEGSNAETDKEVDESDGNALQGKDDGWKKTRKMPRLHVQKIRLFLISLE